MDNIEVAIPKAELAVTTTPKNHPDGAKLLSNLETRLSS